MDVIADQGRGKGIRPDRPQVRPVPPVANGAHMVRRGDAHDIQVAQQRMPVRVAYTDRIGDRRDGRVHQMGPEIVHRAVVAGKREVPALVDRHVVQHMPRVHRQVQCRESGHAQAVRVAAGLGADRVAQVRVGPAMPVHARVADLVARAPGGRSLEQLVYAGRQSPVGRFQARVKGPARGLLVRQPAVDPIQLEDGAPPAGLQSRRAADGRRDRLRVRRDRHARLHEIHDLIHHDSCLPFNRSM